MKIVLASNNAKKLQEMQALLEPLQVTLIPQAALNIVEAEETGLTFVENALIKARHASALTGLPAIADDSGLAVDCLYGAPGIYSARYAGKGSSDAENNAQLLANIANQPTPITARYHCVIVYLRSAKDPTPLITQGSWEGEIIQQPQGSGGFGYDPLFYLAAQKCTAAQLTKEQKSQLSHRSQALRNLISQLSCF